MSQHTYTIKLPRKGNDIDALECIAYEFGGKSGLERVYDRILPYLSVGHVPKADLKLIESQDKLSTIVAIEVRGLVPADNSNPDNNRTVPLLKIVRVRIVSEPVMRGREYEQLEFKLDMALPENGCLHEQDMANRYMKHLQRVLVK